MTFDILEGFFFSWTRGADVGMGDGGGGMHGVVQAWRFRVAAV